MSRVCRQGKTEGGGLGEGGGGYSCQKKNDKQSRAKLLTTVETSLWHVIFIHAHKEHCYGNTPGSTCPLAYYVAMAAIPE